VLHLYHHHQLGLFNVRFHKRSHHKEKMIESSQRMIGGTTK
jgi:hypothetical protein